MKKLLFFAVFLFIGSCIFAQTQTAAPAKFDKVKHSFGNIPQSVEATTVFTFTNTSNKPLVIANVMSSCGCTTPQYAKTPVMPGKKGTIKAGYNAAAPGAFSRTLTVIFAGYDKPTVLTIEGTVNPK